MPFKKPLQVQIIFVMILMSVGSVCQAAEAGLGAYWPGFRNFLAGVIPSKPGLYVRNDLVWYSATADRVVLNDLPVENVSAHVVAEIIEPYYVLPHKLFGATHAVVVTQPFVWAKLSGHIIGTDLNPSGSRSALADTVVSPILLAWNRGNYHYNTNLAIEVPTASFDIHRVVNTSRNYWAFDPELAFTYLNTDAGWDISSVLGCTFSAENPATNYRTGDILHLDYAVGKINDKGLEAGILGYVIAQITPDSGPGAIFGSFKSRVLAIGPAIQYKVPDKPYIMLRYFHEFGASNNLHGDQVALTLRMAF